MENGRRGLTLSDRISIEILLREGCGIREVARRIGRSAGTVSDEIARNGGRGGYCAESAAGRADAARHRRAPDRVDSPGCGHDPEHVRSRLYRSRFQRVFAPDGTGGR
jgi:IS30 family transposase